MTKHTPKYYDVVGYVNDRTYNLGYAYSTPEGSLCIKPHPTTYIDVIAQVLSEEGLHVVKRKEQKSAA